VIVVDMWKLIWFRSNIHGTVPDSHEQETAPDLSRDHESEAPNNLTPFNIHHTVMFY